MKIFTLLIILSFNYINTYSFSSSDITAALKYFCQSHLMNHLDIDFFLLSMPIFLTRIPVFLFLCLFSDFCILDIVHDLLQRLGVCYFLLKNMYLQSTMQFNYWLIPWMILQAFFFNLILEKIQSVTQDSQPKNSVSYRFCLRSGRTSLEKDLLPVSL